ncbi:MAG: DUF4019 domain-containing protein [Thermoanaerobaculia bacterium]
MTSRFCLVLLAVVAFVLQPLAVAAESPEAEAVKTAEAWLALVDTGDYSKSWETAAAYFKGALTKEKWEQALQGVRPPLGKVLSRKVKSKQYATSLPGAPDGEYVVIQFETSFENKTTAIETVTPMKDEDGKWRVSGYFIR